MPRGIHLSEEDRGMIKGLAESGQTISYIAARLNRHRNTISNFLKNPENYGKIKRSGRPTEIDERCKRQIRRLAVQDNKSCMEIKGQLNLDVSKRRINQILNQNKMVTYGSRDAVPRLLKRHITARLQFAEQYKFWSEEFKKVIFSDEKKFNLDGPDSCQKYWRDKRQPRQICHKRNHGGGSLMVWAGFGYAGKSPLCFIPTRTNAEIYIELLETVLIEFAGDHYGDEWIFQQDNAPIHTARKTKDFLAARKIPLLQWPAISPDLNPIEDLWGILSNKVYKNGRQFDTVNDLKKALIKEWDQINPTTLQNLATSMPNRINQIFIKKGKHINY